MPNIQTGLVDRAKNILLTPKTEWPVIDTEPATVGSIYRNYVLILAAIPALASTLGQLLFGYSIMGMTIRLSPVSAISSGIISYILSLVSVFVLALIIDALAPTFGGVKNQVQAVKVAAYSNTAGWVAGILMILPQLSPIAGLLGLYGFYLLYVGLPLLMHAPADKALGYTIVTVIAAIILFVIVGAIVGKAGRMLVPATTFGDATMTGTMTIPGGGTVDLDRLNAAAKQAEASAKQMELAANGQPIPGIVPSALQALLPASLGDYKRTEIESSGANAGGLGGSHAEARYQKDGNEIRLAVTDMAAAGALAALGGAMNVSSNRETATGYEKTSTVGGRIITEKWDNGSRNGSYSEVVSNRFMVSAEGTVGDISELKRAAATIPTDRLAALVK